MINDWLIVQFIIISHHYHSSVVSAELQYINSEANFEFLAILGISCQLKYPIKTVEILHPTLKKAHEILSAESGINFFKKR
jgi:hypothetical protein